MTDQRLRVESGPPQHMLDEPVDVAPSSLDEPAQGEQAADKAQEAAEQARDKAQEVAGPAKEKFQAVASDARAHAQAAAAQAKGKASAQVDERSMQLGEHIGSHGEALDGVADELRRQGKDGPAKVAEQAGQRVKAAADYLQQADGETLVDAATNLARENPAAAAVVGAAAGFAAGRVIKASSSDDSPDAHEQATPPPAPALSDPAPGGP